MNNRIAVYANGYNKSEILKAIEGMKKFAVLNDFDIDVFVSYAAFNERDEVNEGEFNIYTLPNIENYDGAFVFSGLLNSIEVAHKILLNAKEHNVPAISIGEKFEGFPCVSMDNESGMRELVTHMIERHHVKRIVYIGGNKGHTDSVTRLRVIREVLEEHNLTIDDDDIYDGDWTNEKAEEVTVTVINKESGLPDAIMCANDVMALAVATKLRSMRVRVPEDVKVTGYDYLEEGIVFCPSLTTVEMDYYSVGYNSCRMLFDYINHGVTMKDFNEKSVMHIGESCGCGGTETSLAFREEFCRDIHLHNREDAVINGTAKLRRMMVLESEDYDEIHDKLNLFYEQQHYLEGDNFYIIMNRSYLDESLSQLSSVLKDGYGASMDALVAIRDGKRIDVMPGSVNRDNLIPGYVKEKGKQYVHCFCPLYEGRYNYGYVIIQEDARMITSDLGFYEYLRKIRHVYVEFKINLKLNYMNKELKRLYDKDPMTGLFNRFSYESKMNPLFYKSRDKGTHMMIMFIDINYMKRINDDYGHICGDKAICLVADAIRHSVSDKAVPVRFGGDEFIVIEPNSSEASAEEIKEQIDTYIADKIARNKEIYPFDLSVSIGYVITDPDSDYTIQEYVNKADALMYDIKQEYHRTHA